MSAGTDRPDPDGPHPYFMALEEVFLELRGSPLQLAPADWLVAKEWYEQGIPLELVEEILRAAFERLDEEEKEEKIWSLRRFKRQVKAAWKRRQALEAPAAPAETEELDVPARLRRLAAALPAALAERAALGERIRGLEGDAEEIEKRLAEIDHELLTSVDERLPESERAGLESELASALAALAGRLTRAELERARESLRQELLRRRAGLPVLSLFAPEATAEG